MSWNLYPSRKISITSGKEYSHTIDKICAEDFNKLQTKKANQKTNNRKGKTYIRSVEKEKEKGEQLKISGVR
jgi:hypothetical protein